MRPHEIPRTIVAVALAMTAFTAIAACYKAGDPVNCFGGSVGDACTATSPNCSTSQQGTVASLGSRNVIEDANGSAGKNNSTNQGTCKYGCKISPDCEGKTVTVDLNGSSHVAPSGTSCNTGG